MRRLSLGLVLAATACGSAEPRYAVTGMLGIPSSAMVGSNLVFVDAAYDGNPARSSPGMVIDSGSPVVLIDPTFFGLPPPASAADVQTNVDLGLLRDGQVVVTVQQIPVVQLSSGMMDDLGLAGVLGGNVLRQFSVQLDYAAPMGHGFCLGCPATARDDVAPADTQIAFRLRGGLSGQLQQLPSMPAVSAPATRVPVTVTVEGTDYPFILDTGASEVSVLGSLFDALTADGRATLTNFPIATAAGDTQASVTRTSSISVGDQVVSGAPVLATPDIDDLLSEIGQEMGTEVDGLLGGTFLRNFLVTVDYPAGQLHLQRYNVQAWSDEFKRVGIGLTQTFGAAHRYAVGAVYAGTDAAAQGIAFGSQVVSIDGTPLDGLDPFAADQLLDGAVGTGKVLVIVPPGSSAFVTVQVLVDDLIPSP